MLCFNTNYYFTTDQQLFAVNSKMEIERKHACTYIKECHDMAISGNRLFMACSGFDAIVVFDMASENFIEGYHIKHNKTANCIYLAPFNPNSQKGPSPNNTMGLQNIFIKNSRLYFSCLNYDKIFYVEENGSLHISAPIPLGTRFVRAYKEGLLIENASKQSIVHLDMNEKIIESFSIDIPIQPHLREIAVTDSELIIAALAPTHIYVYQSGETDPVQTVHF